MVSEASRPDAAGNLDLARYTLTARVEIAHHLRAIAQAGPMVTVFSNRGRTFILTRFLEVDAKAGVLIFDWGSNPDTNRQMLESERNVFVCSPDGVKTQFVTGAAREVEYEGRQAFEADLPEQVVKLQRREYFRIQTPVINPLVCLIDDFPEGPIELPLYDISLGGIALWLPTASAPGFELGQRYERCRIELPGIGSLNVALEVRHHLTVQQRNGNEAKRVGCYFLNLRPAMENLVQRYVAQLERERRAR
ncbi:flagellar brake protein [Crenobacter cavernae]|uniref:Flagellar brake protein YcgR n=1 Tax=Crenobacter cavernae TaxID=2290923 RepID=A0A345Y5F4_9NEIS|nr:flagellar brake protein [Crenobacter cavernae]